ncbi:hypothetical protein B0H17DRAFT_1207204 [Mycena rosella]|uniref:Uncharacterized protein n=1 Tax=Mycena rosella TaxID=1033263 RepID=A0AAD7D799_MYCRO|nr:hypothetical protein B0H17DRAFT_1207204 [Mycena rosella]
MSVSQLKKAVRASQLQKNLAEKTLRRVLGDITNREEEDDPAPTSKKNAAQKRHQKPPAKQHHIQEDVSSDHETGEDAEDDMDGRSEQSATEQSVTEQSATVTSLGRRFVLLKGLWIKTAVFGATLDDDYDPQKRFDREKVQGQLRDLLDILPDRLKGQIMQEGWFRRAFMAGVNSQRSNTSTRIQHVAGTSIYDCSAGDLLTPAARRKFREEIGWYDFEDGDERPGGTPGEYASLDVSILHKNGSKEYDIHTCFLSPVLMRLFVALIRGANAAAAMLKDESDESFIVPKTDNMERIHQIDHTEPGVIAASSVLAIWGKSADVCLQTRGDHTHIDYEQRSEEYLEILTTGLRKKSPSILRVFSEWDRVVFPNAETSHGEHDGGNGDEQ